MDNKYQDLHIHNWKNNDTWGIRQVEINYIIFTKNKISISFTKNEVSRLMILSKQYNSITID